VSRVRVPPGPPSISIIKDLSFDRSFLLYNSTTMNKPSTAIESVIASILFYAFLMWAVYVAGILYVFSIAHLHNFALAFIATAPVVLIAYALLYKYVIRKALATLHLAGYDKGLAHYFIYGFMLVSIVFTFYAGAWYSDSGTFFTPTSRQAWRYDQCAFINGGGGRIGSSKSVECVQPNGKMIMYP
jgi:hypothetical protein